MDTPLAWKQCFKDPDTGEPLEAVTLTQIEPKYFALESSLEFVGDHGVDNLPAEALVLHPTDLGEGARTNLASVPAAMTWFVGRYGLHTPATLIHDRLIGDTKVDGVSDAMADSLYRYMLEALGVRFLRRWLVWAAVSGGTRWRAGGSKQVMLIAWVVVSALAQLGFIYAVMQRNVPAMLLIALGPFLGSLLWGQQWKAGALAAYCAPFLLPPTALGGVGILVYRLLEAGLSKVVRRPGHQPAGYDQF